MTPSRHLRAPSAAQLLEEPRLGEMSKIAIFVRYSLLDISFVKAYVSTRLHTNRHHESEVDVPNSSYGCAFGDRRWRER